MFRREMRIYDLKISFYIRRIYTVMKSYQNKEDPSTVRNKAYLDSKIQLNDNFGYITLFKLYSGLFLYYLNVKSVSTS